MNRNCEQKSNLILVSVPRYELIRTFVASSCCRFVEQFYHLISQEITWIESLVETKDISDVHRGMSASWDRGQTQ